MDRDTTITTGDIFVWLSLVIMFVLKTRSVLPLWAVPVWLVLVAIYTKM